MALPFPIFASQTDAKSPVDDQLMDAIRLDLDYLEAQQQLSKSFDYQFKLNGRLDILPARTKRRFDGTLISQSTTFQTAKLYLENPGTSGTLEADVRKITRPNTPITEVARLFKANINSIARAGSALSTQSITRSTAQIATQSVAQWKPNVAIASIIGLGSNLFRYNFTTAIDADWKVGDLVTFASTTAPANSGLFTIVRVRDDGGSNVVISNGSGVNQTGSAGTARLEAWVFTYTNPVSSEFAAGEVVTFSGHSVSGNNGNATIYATNQGGNNIIAKNHSNAPADQPGASGAADVNRWIFALTASAPSDFAVGEKLQAASHTSGGNNGNFRITAVNQGGNNVIAYNPSGVVQGGAAGNISSLRWVYFFSTDPSANVIVGDRVFAKSASSAANNGLFTVVQVNRATADNIVVYNESGVAQGGAAGTLETTKALVKFASDQSSIYTVASYVEFKGTVQAGMDDENFAVLQVNRGGGANFNIVVDSVNAVEQAGNAGRVIIEEKSIFSTRPSLTLPTSTTDATNRHLQVATNAVLNAEAVVAANTMLAAYLLQVPAGTAENVVISII